MAYTLKTLADMQQALADKISAGTVPASSTTLAYWTRMLNQGMAYCSDKLRLEKSASISISSGTYTTSDDFILVNRLVNSGGIEMTQISKSQSVGMGGLCFWVTGNQTDGFVINMPTGNDGTYTLYYSYRPAEMTATTDVCVIPDPLAVVCYAYSKLRMAQTDPLEDADKEMGECERRLNEIIDQQQLNDQPLGFSSQTEGSNTWFKSL